MWVVVADHLEVAAEKGVIAYVEADNGCVAITISCRSLCKSAAVRHLQADVCFGQVFAEDELEMDCQLWRC